MRKFSILMASFGIVMTLLSVLTFSVAENESAERFISLLNIGIGVLLIVFGLLYFVKHKE